ncbi:sugar ABC transporter substrate-binding protein [Corallincola spongiicola]|uniref:Extracellular solute-binding protein n=1 Tax=Corallincola spongiicola TaxID=2520508 RepID=A0ABY1WR77_9GAMM|nr:extracellular solute-binding protein [Corallincola spongiicola]TAA47098.1 extracellular solute-binding protein [Corallincola spongiicola]
MRLFTRLLVLLSFMSGSLHAAELELWHAHQARAFIEQVVENFTKETGVTVNITPFAPAKVKGELLLGAASGLTPDVVLVPSDFLGLHNELKLTALNSEWNDPALDESARQTTVIAGRQYGVPIIQGNHLMMFYNKKYIPQPAASWKQLAAQQKELKQRAVKAIGWNYGEMYWFVPFLGAFDGWPMDSDKVTLNTPAMIKALNFYRSLSDQGLVPKGCNYDCAQGQFLSGEYAYSINGDWAYSDFKKELGDSLGVALLPTIDGKPLKPMSSSFVLAFPRMQEKSETAEKLQALARFFQQAENQRYIYEQYRLLPVNDTVFSQIRDNAKGDEKVILEQLALTKAMPSEPAMAITWEALAKGYKRFMDHGYSAEKAAAYMQSLADRELKKYQGK